MVLRDNDMIYERHLRLNLRKLCVIRLLNHQNCGSRLHFGLVPVGGISVLHHC